MDYFFDTYTLIETLEGNPNYENFSEYTFITTTLNLSEFYYYLLRQNGENTADKTIKNLNFELVEISPEIAIKGAKFKHKYKKESLSYIDCIGYIVAFSNNLRFLTGDEKFKNKKNVEFVK